MEFFKPGVTSILKVPLAVHRHVGDQCLLSLTR